MEYETEEQQLEAIKKWWKENSSTVVLSVAIGVAAIFGWQYYQINSVKHTEQASVIYEQVLINAENPQKLSDQLAGANELEAKFSDTPYASLSALLVAKQQLASGDIDNAKKQYQWVIDNATQDELMYLAKVRLSRLLLGNDEHDAALAILNETFPDSFMAMVSELKGDALFIKGDNQAAKAQYVKAKLLTKGSSRWLQLKIDELGGEASAAAETVEGSEPSA